MGFVSEGLYSIIKAAQYLTPALCRPAKRWTMRERERERESMWLRFTDRDDQGVEKESFGI